MTVTDISLRHDIIATYRKVKTLRGTARELNLDRKLVKRWVARWKQLGKPMPIAKSGRPRSLDPQAAALAVTWLTESDMGLEAVARKLHEEGHTARQLHKTTVARWAKRTARQRGDRLRAQTGRPAPMLSEANKQARVQFARDNKGRDWNQVMFTDRKKFLLKSPGSSIGPVTWTVGDRKRSATRVTHPAVVNVYAGLTIHGVTKCHVVTGTTGVKTTYLNKKLQPARNITHDEYSDVVKQTFIPEGDKLFRVKGVTKDWGLQQDNDPTHKAALAQLETRNRARQGRVALLKNWPPNSPDLNIIENLWSIVSRAVQARACKNAAEFKAAVLEEMAAVPQSTINNLFAHMKVRIKDVIKNGGNRLAH